MIFYFPGFKFGWCFELQCLKHEPVESDEIQGVRKGRKWRLKSLTVAESIAPEIHGAETVKWVHAEMLVCRFFFLQFCGTKNVKHCFFVWTSHPNFLKFLNLLWGKTTSCQCLRYNIIIGCVGRGFNQNLEQVTLPPSLQTLTFGYDFNQSLDHVTLPPILQNVDFWSCL